jgi:uncharacterized protein (TIGR02246 family)
MATQNVTRPANDEAAIRATIASVYTAWRDQDADAFVARYADRAVALHPGSILPGRDAIHGAITEGMKTHMRGSEALHEIDDMRFLGADAAFVIGRQAVRHDGEQAPSPESCSRTTWVLSRDGDGWRVEGFHSLPETVA